MMISINTIPKMNARLTPSRLSHDFLLWQITCYQEMAAWNLERGKVSTAAQMFLIVCAYQREAFRVDALRVEAA